MISPAKRKEVRALHSQRPAPLPPSRIRYTRTIHPKKKEDKQTFLITITHGERHLISYFLLPITADMCSRFSRWKKHAEESWDEGMMKIHRQFSGGLWISSPEEEIWSEEYSIGTVSLSTALVENHAIKVPSPRVDIHMLANETPVFTPKPGGEIALSAESFILRDIWPNGGEHTLNSFS